MLDDGDGSIEDGAVIGAPPEGAGAFAKGLEPTLTLLLPLLLLAKGAPPLLEVEFPERAFQ